MHTAVSPNETKTKQNAAPQAEAVEPAAPSSPPDGTDGEATGGASGTQALLQPDEQLQALLAENEALRKENQELLLRCDAFEKESIGKTDDIRRQLTELKTALTDRVYLLVCAYEETIEKIDSLIESLPAEIARDGAATAQAQTRAVDTGAVPHQTRLPSGDSLSSKAADTLTEEKKVSIIETLKNNSTPAEPVKPAFGVSHKERANAKNLLKKYSKIQ